MSNITAALLAFPVASAIWFSFMAEPLKIEKTTFHKDIYSPGAHVIASSTGQKSIWARRFCKPTQSSLFLKDSTGLIAEFETPRNYNDGSIRRVRTMRQIPVYFSPGAADGWESVTYRCLGIRDFTVYSQQRGSFTIEGD